MIATTQWAISGRNMYWSGESTMISPTTKPPMAPMPISPSSPYRW